MKVTILLVASRAAATELPRRLAATLPALAGIVPMTLDDLVRALAEPALLGRGQKAWDHGHGALLAARLLDEAPAGFLAPDLPRAPVASALAGTCSLLRRYGIAPEAVVTLAETARDEDTPRLRWLASLYRSFTAAVEGHFADPATCLRAATAAVAGSFWLHAADVLIAGELELSAPEKTFLAELARVRPARRVDVPCPPSLHASSFSAWAEVQGIPRASIGDTPLAPLGDAQAGPLRSFHRCLFEPPTGVANGEGCVDLVTAPGEAAEVRAIVRRILREAARGVPFEAMGIVLPRPEEYARLLTDLLDRLNLPYRIHPSLPLRFGRTARALLLLFRCRGLRRREVMEFLTFAPVPFSERLGPGVGVRPALWDLLSREAGIVSGLDRWQAGTAALAAEAERAAARETDPERRERHVRRAQDARGLFRLVSALDETLAELWGEASWDEWSARLLRALDAWTRSAPTEVVDREAVRSVLVDLAGLASLSRHAAWEDVETVVTSRLEWERQPTEPLSQGGIHVGAIDALAGVPFQFLAILGLVEGGFPGVLRPDPLLLDTERVRLSAADAAPVRRPGRGQLSLFDEEVASPAPHGARLPTIQDRLLEARRVFARAVGQAQGHLVLSYPRADARTGRERLPSLFFMAAATARAGRAVGAEALAQMLVEDTPLDLPPEDALDPSERDRARVRAGGREAVEAIAAGSRFFRQSRLASRARWSHDLTAYDGLVAGPPVTPEIAAALDPVRSSRPMSASRLATFAQCGFRYLLENVLRLEAVPEPEERMRLDPLERGSLFHEVAEGFLRERRDAGQLPVRSTPEERARLLEIADGRLEALVAGAPPRFTVLWQRERERFHDSLLLWLNREARSEPSLPLHFEVGFGLSRPGAEGEPHLAEPLAVDLGDGRILHVSGKIDRIDRRNGGGLIVRDYKTGRIPKTEGSLFRGGRQLQIPFYVLAATQLFPEEPVVQAFLDYVDGGRRVELDLAAVTGEGFHRTVRALVSAIAQGSFVQEPQACEWCDFRVVCGPSALIERRRRLKLSDPRVAAYLRLRDLP